MCLDITRSFISCRPCHPTMFLGFLWELLLENKRLTYNQLKAFWGLRKKRFLFPALHFLITLRSKGFGAFCKLPWAEPLNPSSSRASLLIVNEEEIEAERNFHRSLNSGLSLKMLVFWGWLKVAWEGCVMSRSVTYSSSLFLARLPLRGLPNIPPNGAPHRAVAAWTWGYCHCIRAQPVTLTW